MKHFEVEYYLIVVTCFSALKSSRGDEASLHSLLKILYKLFQCSQVEPW